MSHLPMYPGMINSPITELAQAITDTDTTIEIVDGDALPDAPNLATIGAGENAETILYVEKTGNILSDVTRGFQGTARAWQAGVKVARNFTEYDYDAMRLNIENMDSEKINVITAKSTSDTPDTYPAGITTFTTFDTGWTERLGANPNGTATVTTEIGDYGPYQKVVIRDSSGDMLGVIERTGTSNSWDSFVVRVERAEFAAHLNETVTQLINVKGHGAKGDGATDDTSAIQAAIDDAPVGSTIFFPDGTYLVSSQIEITKRINLLSFNATIKETTILESPLIKISEVSRLFVSGLNCEGAETYSSFAGTPSSNAFIFLDKCNEALLSNIYVSGKSYGIILNSCSDCKVQNLYFDGILETPKAGANYSSCVFVNRGIRNSISGVTAKNTGSGVLVGGDSREGTISHCKISNAQDNGVYISSGFDWVVRDVLVRTTVGSGVKVRGSNHKVLQCDVRDCSIGYSLTGNGTEVDEFGYNGHGNILSECTAENCSEDGISVGSQDGYYGRDFKILNNIIINSATSGGGYAGLRGGGGKNLGHLIQGNRFEKTSGQFAVVLTGAEGNEVTGLTIANNDIVESVGIGIRLAYVHRSIVSENKFRDVTGVGIDLRYCQYNQLTGNIDVDGTGTALIASGANYDNKNNVISLNRGPSLSVDLSNNACFNNMPNIYTTDITVAPHYVGQLALSGGNFYQATGTSNASNWKQITN